MGSKKEEREEKEKRKENMNNSKNDLSNMLKKTWDFIWHSDSVWSWLINIVLAFVFIKFIFYPGVGILLTGSELVEEGDFNRYPLVAVVSGSMEHMKISHDKDLDPHLCGNEYDKTDYIVNFDEYWKECGLWYMENGITKEQFSKYTFKRGFNKGDIIFIYRKDPKNLKIGDVIVFKSNVRPDPIIHRVVSIDTDGNKIRFDTKGDHNQGKGSLDKGISEDVVIGVGVFRVPYLGWFKIWFVDLIGWLQKQSLIINFVSMFQ